MLSKQQESFTLVARLVKGQKADGNTLAATYSVAKALRAKAKQQGVTPSDLASELLRQQLGLAA